MAEHDDDHHGNSRAAWVMVGIVLLGSVIMAVGFVIPSLPVILGSVVVIVLGLVAGKLLALAGHGVNGDISRRDVNLS